MKRFVLFAVFLFTGLPATADSFSLFVLQNGQMTLMDPASKPLIVGYASPDAPGIDFIAAPLPFPSFTFTFVLTVGGYVITQPQVTLPNNCDPNGPLCGIKSALALPPDMFKTPTDGTFTITINGTTQTYSLQYETGAAPPLTTPEPASLLLLSTGLGIVGWLKRKQQS